MTDMVEGYHQRNRKQGWLSRKKKEINDGDDDGVARWVSSWWTWSHPYVVSCRVGVGGWGWGVHAEE